MYEGRKINKKHPAYEEYIEKCNKIKRRMMEETDPIEYQGGLDGTLSTVYKKYSFELKKLQKEYGYLFLEG